MTPRSLVEIRQHPATRTAAVTMGLLTVTGAFAPAALAADGTAAPATDTSGAVSPESGSAVAPQVLTTTPAPTTAASAPGGAHYGTGKLALALAASDDGVPADTSINSIGAQVQVHFTQVDGAPVSLTDTCTIDMFGSCGGLPSGTPLPKLADGTTYASVPQNSLFTLTLVHAPTSGALMSAGAVTATGYSDTTVGTTMSLDGFPLAAGTITAPGAYRTVQVALSGTGSLAGDTFTIGADTATTDAQGVATFSGRYLTSVSIVQTSAPGGTSFDPAPHTLTVPPATSLTERATPVPLSITGVVGPVVTTPVTTTSTTTSTPPAPTSSTPTSTAPTASTAAVPTIAAGKKQTVTLSGFQPFEMVHGVLHSTPVDLGTVQADANGVATFTFTVPTGLESGSHEVAMTGLTSNYSDAVGFTVTAAASSGGLAYTGTDVVPLLALGGGLLAAGAGAITVANRRRAA